jgi:hypothetical protein
VAALWPRAIRAASFYHLFTLRSAFCDHRKSISGALKGTGMVFLAVAMFIALFGWGARFFGWDDPGGKIQLALATCFILGIISGYKAKID